MKEELPQLKIVKLENIRLREEADPFRVKRIKKSIKKNKIFTNPVIVARVNENNYVLLDGANRFNTCKELGCQDILVQIVDYKDPRMKLESWNHVLMGVKKNIFLKKIEKLGFKLNKVNFNKAKDLLKRKKALCFFEFDNRTRYYLKNSTTIRERV